MSTWERVEHDEVDVSCVATYVDMALAVLRDQARDLVLVGPLRAAKRWLADLANSGGPDLRVNAHVKVAEEARELAEDPSPEEWADVAIALVGTALGHGWSVATLAAAVRDKVEVNRARTWVEKPDGTWRHE